MYPSFCHSYYTLAKNGLFDVSYKNKHLHYILKIVEKKNDKSVLFFIFFNFNSKDSDSDCLKIYQWYLHTLLNISNISSLITTGNFTLNISMTVVSSLSCLINICCFLSDHHGWGIWLIRWYVSHDRCISYSQMLDTNHPG